MKRLPFAIKLKTLSVMLLLPFLLGTLPARAGGDPPLPQPLPPTGNCYDDNIFYGAVLPGDETSPVLVFVHGLSGLAEDWWSANTSAGLNDMYYQAYWAGYRTAFVNLNVDPNIPDCTVERRPADDMFDDGNVLTMQLNTITAHYNVEKVDIIAHSKGGIDSQAAIIWSEAWPMVRNVFTLGTPHQGSILVDQLWSPEGFWLSVLLGQRDQATFSLRTGFMQLFRQATDSSTLDDDIHYYSGAGNYWQTPNTIFEVTGEWLQNNPEGGDNDGVVTVDSTYLLDATSLFLEPWNHNQIYQGYNAFPFIQEILTRPEITESKLYLPLLIRVTGPSNSVVQAKPRTSNTILRGGLISKSVTESIPIESQATHVHFSFITTDPALTGVLVSPTGQEYRLMVERQMDQTVFKGGFLLEQTIDHPQPGQWVFRLDSATEAAYFLIVALDSPLEVGLSGFTNRPVEPGKFLQLAAQATDGSEIESVTFQTILNTPLVNRNTFAGSVLNYAFSQEGIYGVSVQVNGITSDGTPFERTFIVSQAVIQASKSADRLNLLDFLANQIFVGMMPNFERGGSVHPPPLSKFGFPPRQLR
ncbi:MAG TPA: hypothetical protein VI451_19585 [Anaerolineales bacterium]|nr:hypothetical protein [Anaerolineales bacterium]